MKFSKYQADIITVSFFSLLILINPLTAEAYIDPGTGSIIIQAVIAFVAVAGFYFRTFLGKIISFFNFLSSKKQKNKEDNTEASPVSSDEHKER